MPVISPLESSTTAAQPDILQTLLGRAQQSPDDPDALVDLAVQLHALGQDGPALQLLEQSARLHPGHVRCWMTLAEILLTLQELSTAVTCFQRAAQLLPMNEEVQLRLAEAQTDLGEVSGAITTYENLLGQHPRSIVALVNLASLLRGQGDVVQAVQLLRRAIEYSPGHATAQFNLGNCYAVLGQFAAACDSYSAALPVHPQPAKVFYNLSTIQKFEDQDRACITRWTQLANSKLRTVDDHVHLQFALGKVHNDLGEPESAWKHYEQGNQLVQTDFNPEAHADRLHRLAGAWSSEILETLPRAELSVSQPVFIVGMPRSGTTLVEQLLMQRTGIAARGEQSALPRVLQNFIAERGADEWLPPTSASVDDMNALAANYIRQVIPSIDGGAFTDKLPANFFRVGWIALLFPAAVILHVRRDPRDVCLSCYFQHFTQRLPYTYRLEYLAAYWQAYEKLMQHWHSVLPGRVIDIHYEELVERPDFIMEEVLLRSGLTSTAAATPIADAPIATASHWQARQAVHTRSRKKWERYRQWLPEAIIKLGDGVQ